jgi:hypothetical protein
MVIATCFDSQANLEPLNIFEFLRTVLFVSKAADPCVSGGWPSVLVSLNDLNDLVVLATHMFVRMYVKPYTYRYSEFEVFYYLAFKRCNIICFIYSIEPARAAL